MKQNYILKYSGIKFMSNKSTSPYPESSTFRWHCSNKSQDDLIFLKTWRLYFDSELRRLLEHAHFRPLEKSAKLKKIFLNKTYVVCTQKNRLNETVLSSTQNKCLKWSVRTYLKTFQKALLLTHMHTT